MPPPERESHVFLPLVVADELGFVDAHQPQPPDVPGQRTATRAQLLDTTAANDPAGVPEDARRPPMTPADPMLLLAYWHLRREFAALRREAVHVRAGDSPTGVHEMRIATRRLRAALRAFKALLPLRLARYLAKELHWLAAALGRVRDLDVYRGHIADYLDGLPPAARDALQPYIEQLGADHATARQGLLDVLDSSRYAQFMARIARELSAAPSAAALRRWQNFRVADGAPQYVDERLKRLRRRARRLDRDCSPEQLHALRIRCKRLRYLLELFAPLYGRALEAPIAALKRLQDTLGRYQDATIASQRLEAYAASLPVRKRDPQLLLALGRLAQVQTRCAIDARNRGRKAWRRFEDRVSRRKLREVLANAG